MTCNCNDHLKNNSKRDRYYKDYSDSSLSYRKKHRQESSDSDKYSSDDYSSKRCRGCSDRHCKDCRPRKEKCYGCNYRDCDDCRPRKEKCYGCNYRDCDDCRSKKKKCHGCNYHDCDDCRSKKKKCHGCNYHDCDDCQFKYQNKCNGCIRRDCYDCNPKRDHCGGCKQRDCYECYPKKDKCGKCRKRRCCCIEHVDCYNTKCGFISISLEREANPTFFTAAGQNVTFTYKVTNTGTEPICDPLRISDTFLGDQIVNCNFIYPCTSQTFVRTYTTTPNDVTNQRIETCATAFIEIDCRKWVASCPVPLTLTNGSADVFGNMTQTINGSVVNATVTLSNSTTSSSAGQDVTLSLLFPAGVTSVTAGTPSPIIGPNSVYMSVPSLAIGESRSYNFSYTPASTAPGSAYTFDGNVTATSYDPNLGNNHVVSTVTF